MKSINHIITLSLFSLITLPVLCTSCSEEDGPVVVGDDEISFMAYMPGVASRSTYDLSDQLVKAGFTVSAFCPESNVSAGGILPTHFEDKTVSLQADGIYRSDECRWPTNAQQKIGSLKIFAFHPSRPVMKGRAGVGNQNFIFLNNTKKDASGVNYDYRLTKFRVAPDISKQVDFVTAIGEGNKTANLYSDVKVKFEHQLCGVEVSAWGGSTLYDMEIAGVRIGGTVVEADFSLSAERGKVVGDENTIGEWIFPDDPMRGHVDYVFAPGDKVVQINSSSHNTAATAASIMGNGGKALVIPYKHDKWDNINDKANKSKGMYFSALVRMTEHDGDNHCIYPSTDPESQDYIVFLSVRISDGTVMKRLTKNEYANYMPPAGEEKRAYGWTAVPVNVDWKAGYTYSYVLNYSVGVGVHDPVDPNPAGPIIDYEGVEITTKSGLWADGETIKIGEWSWGAGTNNTGPDGTVWWK